MKTIGLIGGMSWESTVSYYKTINTVVRETLGGFHSAKILLYSVDFDEMESYQATRRWDKSARILGDIAKRLEAAGADCIAICTNTMHKIAGEVQAGIEIPLLHIAEMTADRLLEQGIDTVALLGTKYTMEEDFYKERLRARGITVLIPDAEQRQTINHVIFHELCLGTVSDTSRGYYLEVIGQLARQGAQAAILGCTEIGLLVKQEHTPVPLFDTAEIHAEGIARFALEG